MMEKLQKIASYWHGGQWSAMYQLASSGVFLRENTLQYLWEANAELIQYGRIHEIILSKAKRNELRAFIKGIEALAKQHGIEVEWAEHPIYSYSFPVIVGKIDFQMKPITLLT